MTEARRLRQARTAMYGTVLDAEIAGRTLHIWLPPDLHGADDRRPVIYMADGQHVFDGSKSPSGASWELDRALASLGRAGVRLPIVVAHEHGAARRPEYMPPEGLAASPTAQTTFESLFGPARADQTLDVLVNEIKPVIDLAYPTLPDSANTFHMGSSMGGLFSLYAMCHRPDVFSAAASLSLHWAIAGAPLVPAMAGMLPDPSSHRLYSDHGTITLDRRYLVHQPVFDELARARGYVDDVNYLSLEFPRTRHNEAYWAARVVVPLVFLLVGASTAGAIADAFGGRPTPPEVPEFLYAPYGR